MIVDIQDIPAAGSDGQALMPTIERVEQHAGVTVEQVIGDGAYGSGENRAACAAEHVDLMAPAHAAARPEQWTSRPSRSTWSSRRRPARRGTRSSGKPGPKEHGRPTLQFTFATGDLRSLPAVQALRQE